MDFDPLLSSSSSNPSHSGSTQRSPPDSGYLDPDYLNQLDWLFGRINYERIRAHPDTHFKLDRMRRLLELLGNPHQSYPCIHVAGTKGKGSTATMLASVLRQAGIRCGLSTSPHLERIEERIDCAGSACTPNEMHDLLRHIRPVVERFSSDSDLLPLGEPTFFEIVTAAAFLKFAWEQLQIAVMEVGLGGRLDSTNVCQPAVSVITSISLDHTRELGDTLAKIAGEKAGIIKRGIPVVTAVQAAEPLAEIRRIAEKKQAPLFVLGRDFFFDPNSTQPAPSQFTFRQVRPTPWSISRLGLNVLGQHQIQNAATALAAIGTLPWAIPDSAARDGLAAARCPARAELIRRDPPWLLDTAHNDGSTQALAQLLTKDFQNPHRILIYAASGDKQIRNNLEILLQTGFDHVVVTRFRRNPRAALPDELARIIRQLQPHRSTDTIHITQSPADAWHAALQLADDHSLILATGSFFLAAEIRGLMMC